MKKKVTEEIKVHYNPWPIGNIPKELQRPELTLIKEKGYEWNDPRDVITMFENKVAKFAGSKYAVSTDCCSHAIELSLRYLMSIGEIIVWDIVNIPAHTYISIPMLLDRLNLHVEYNDAQWSGGYGINPTRVIDAAVMWEKNMYSGHNTLQCLSFQIKKRIPIGRGGMVLTDDKEAADWIRLASYDGRDLNIPYNSSDHIKINNGFHYYMTPEDAARGILLMDSIKEEGHSGNYSNYPDVRKMLKLI